MCWTGVAGRNVHDLLPMPYTDESLQHVIRRVKRVQEILEQPIALENAASYLEWRSSTWTEEDFLATLAEEADCAILLDINNVYVNAFNHSFDPHQYIQRIPVDRVVQHHLSGHTHCRPHILDTHSDLVVDEVWGLYRTAYRRFGSVSTLLEWDENAQPFETVHAEVLRAAEQRRAAVKKQEDCCVV